MSLFNKILLSIVLLCLCWFITEAAITLREIRSTNEEVRKRVVETSQNINGLIIQVSLVADQARQLAETQQDVAKKTAANTERLTREGANALARFNTTIEKVNNEILPQMQKTLETANLQIQNTGEETANTLAVTRKGLEETLRETAKVTSSLNEVVSDPSIKASLQNIEATSKATAGTAQHIEGASREIEGTTEEIHKAVKRATKPANLAFKVLSWLWDKAMGAKVAF